MKILQLGDGLVKLCPHVLVDMAAGKRVVMNKVFTMIHPLMEICYDNIHHFMNAVYLLQIKPFDGSNTTKLALKGK